MGCRPKKDAHYPGDVFNYGFRDETKDIPVLIGNCFGEFDSMIPLLQTKGKYLKNLSLKPILTVRFQSWIKETLSSAAAQFVI